MALRYACCSRDRHSESQRRLLSIGCLGACEFLPRADCSIKNIDCREVAVLQELQRRAAAGGDVADLVGEAELLDGGGGVAAADDRGGAVAGGVGDGLGDGLGA